MNVEKPAYQPQEIEKKWQAIWEKNKTFAASDKKGLLKYYVLDMFPYPSGAGLHVGHLVGYTATDIMARYQKQRGKNVLHPMGWDSFGLPAEQYAIRTGTHPAITTHVNIKKFKEQLKRVGYAYDWDREISTSEPNYYKWTQWLFTKLYEKGLAYESDMLVNYCPALGTVLANEEIENGRSKEGGHPIERRPLKQWILKITAYADRLLEDLKLLDWPESLKKLQQNWIGKSEGALIEFQVEGKERSISVFTTRPDTLFGVTYLVLSPEHPLVEVLTIPEYEESVHNYKRECSAKTDLERSELAKEKTGVFTGGFVLHPITSKRIPVWIGDYVLMGYGTGAVMAVPWHDERDYHFAKKFSLPIVPVIVPVEEELNEGTEHYSGEGVYINSSASGLTLDGLYSPGEGVEKMVSWLEKKEKGKRSTSYKLRDWLFSRQRYWGEPIPIVHFEDGTMRPLGLDELPLLPPEMLEFTPTHGGESPLAKERDWVEIEDPKTGKKARRETNTMPQWAGSCWYYLRFLDPHNAEEAWEKEKERYWLPVDLYVGGAEHAVLHLLYARFWHKVFYDCGLVSTLEPFQKLLNQGLIVAPSFQRQNGHYVPPEAVVEKEGRYFHWETNEELRHQVDKMSKSKLNGVSPDEVIEKFGADAVRLYMMFMGPIDKEKVWHTEAIGGMRRFLNRFFEMAHSEKIREEENFEGMKLAHRLVHGVTGDIEKMLFNTAISKMMEFLNAFLPLAVYPKKAVKMAVQLLAPFAPHLAEELWEHLGETDISSHPWPVAEEKYLFDEKATYVVQINGKLRARLELPKGKSQEEILAYALEDANVNRFLLGKIEKVVFVPDKLLSVVTAG